MTIEQMKKKKLELGLTAEMIADQSGVPVSTVAQDLQRRDESAEKADDRCDCQSVE